MCIVPTPTEGQEHPPGFLNTGTFNSKNGKSIKYLLFLKAKEDFNTNVVQLLRF